jgi:hypothetical protein
VKVTVVSGRLSVLGGSLATSEARMLLMHSDLYEYLGC